MNTSFSTSRLATGAVLLMALLSAYPVRAQDIPLSGVIGEEPVASSSVSSSVASEPDIPMTPEVVSSSSSKKSRASSVSSAVQKSSKQSSSSSKAPKSSSTPEVASSASSKSRKTSSSSESSAASKPVKDKSEEPFDESLAITFTLRPHCDKQKASACDPYAVVSPTTIETPELAVGETLDMDLIALNPGNLPLQKVRAWVVYDPYVFDGELIEFSEPYAGEITEEEFDADYGYVKLEANADEAPTSETVVVARIQLTVIEPDTSGKTIIGFDDQEDDLPHTYVFQTESSTENIVSQNLGVLVVNLSLDSPPDEELHEAPDADEATDDEALLQSGTGSRTAFVLLQPQNVQITTEGDSIYVSWDALPSYEVVGYNVYYSTVSGRYIQRRTVTPDATGIAIQSLPKGVAYYVAVRGVNSLNEETAFSQEVAVTVGNAATSTSPFLATVSVAPAPVHPLTPAHAAAPVSVVPGESGSSTLLTLALVFSAIAGTIIAVRKQRNMAYRTFS